MAKHKRLKLTKPMIPAIEWLEDASGKQVRILLAGSRRAMIENHTGIIEFSETRIRLMTRAGILSITGEALTLTHVRTDALTIRGVIAALELPAEKEEADDA